MQERTRSASEDPLHGETIFLVTYMYAQANVTRLAPCEMICHVTAR